MTSSHYIFKMDGILDLRKEHVKIEKVLILIEEILNKKKLDVGRTRYVFNKLFVYLRVHEGKEDSLFTELSKQGSDIGDVIGEINLFHALIKGHIKILRDALYSNDEQYLRLSLENDGRMFFSKLREHIHNEERIFDSIMFFNLSRLSFRVAFRF